jgi:hypothetical protein
MPNQRGGIKNMSRQEFMVEMDISWLFSEFFAGKRHASRDFENQGS